MNQRIAISNIAWDVKDDESVADLLNQLGIDAIELAPTKVFQSATPSKAEISSYVKKWQKKGIEIVAIQSVLFGRPDLTIFNSNSTKDATLEYLKKFVVISKNLGSKILVFGSPKNRVVPSELDQNVAYNIAKDFFGKIGDFAYKNNVIFCIEPNPLQYQTNFINTGLEGINFVKELQNQGIGLHLDAAGMYLADDDTEQVISNSRGILEHFHISAPYLESIVSSEVDYGHISNILKLNGYPGWHSIEMKPIPGNESLKEIELALRLAQRTF